jgi:hypothetical protein
MLRTADLRERTDSAAASRVATAGEVVMNRLGSRMPGLESLKLRGTCGLSWWPMGPQANKRRLWIAVTSGAVLVLLVTAFVLVRWDFVSALVQGNVHWCTTTGAGFDPNMMECDSGTPQR